MYCTVINFIVRRPTRKRNSHSECAPDETMAYHQYLANREVTYHHERPAGMIRSTSVASKLTHTPTKTASLSRLWMRCHRPPHPLAPRKGVEKGVAGDLDNYKEAYRTYLIRDGFFNEAASVSKHINTHAKDNLMRFFPESLSKKDQDVKEEEDGKAEENCRHEEESAFNPRPDARIWRNCCVCSRPIRGLVVGCLSCGHTGHFTHLRRWFMDRNEVCPVKGCPCRCEEIRGSFHLTKRG